MNKTSLIKKIRDVGINYERRTTTIGDSAGCCSSLREEVERLELAPCPTSSLRGKELLLFFHVFEYAEVVAFRIQRQSPPT
jgi:hypothetical protein